MTHFFRSLKISSLLAYCMLHEVLLSDNGISQSISEGLSQRKSAVVLHEELLTVRESTSCPGTRLYSETWCRRMGLKTIQGKFLPHQRKEMKREWGYCFWGAGCLGFLVFLLLNELKLQMEKLLLYVLALISRPQTKAIVPDLATQGPVNTNMVKMCTWVCVLVLWGVFFCCFFHLKCAMFASTSRKEGQCWLVVKLPV